MVPHPTPIQRANRGTKTAKTVEKLKIEFFANKYVSIILNGIEGV
jgi:hypothetical protein